MNPHLPLDHTQTPFLDALFAYVDEQTLGFHVPGHQQARAAAERLKPLAAADITQVPGIDDIHRPVWACKRAQELAAAAFGADHSYFLTNGSSAGNQAMMMAALQAGQTVLMPRNAHVSSYAAVLLSGAQPAFYNTPFDHQMQVYHPATPASVEVALKKHPEARALHLVTPSYYGAAADVEQLVELAHRHGLVVLVDEAWGAHLHFHEALPMSAVAAGADLTVQSTHKLGSALSGASMLHLKGERIDRPRLEAVLRLLLSTSPYFPLLASLDWARRQLVLEGRQALERALRLAHQAREQIAKLEGLVCFGGSSAAHSWDLTRLVVSACGRGLSGYEVEQFLRYQKGIQVEMAELGQVVLVVTGAHNEQDIERLVQALGQLPRGRENTLEVRLPPPPRAGMSMRQAFLGDHRSVELEAAEGCLCAEFISAYPPGIPLLLPGEVVTSELIDYLKVEQNAGVHIQGAFDTSLKTIRVLKDPTK